MYEVGSDIFDSEQRYNLKFKIMRALWRQLRLRQFPLMFISHRHPWKLNAKKITLAVPLISSTVLQTFSRAVSRETSRCIFHGFKPCEYNEKQKSKEKQMLTSGTSSYYFLWALMHDLSLIIASARKYWTIANIFEALKYLTWTNLPKTALTLIYVKLFICYYSIAFQIVVFFIQVPCYDTTFLTQWQCRKS